MQGDVSDPSDWLATQIASLSTLDAALRCQVCKEFYDTPMITSCSHTFCSLCIRRCFSNDGKCPTCRAEDQSSKLRRNWTVQECVDGFVKSRKQIMELAVRDPEGEDTSRRKRRKVGGQNQDRDSLVSAESIPRRSTRSQRKAASASQEVIVLDEDVTSDTDYRPDEAQIIKSSSPVEPEDGLVACPMCSKRMKEELVFSHLDRCDGKELKKKTPPPSLNCRPQGSESRQPTTPSKHLPHLNYSLLKDNALKKKLQELGIPTWGSRHLHIRRHSQWVDIFNANSDSVRPKSNRELLRDLDVWERTQGGHSQTHSGPTGVMRKDFDGIEWTGRHKTQFDDLVAQARAKQAAKAQSELNTATKSDAMEGVTTSTNKESSGEEPLSASTTHSPRRKVSSDGSATPASPVIQSSPLASMLHSAAEDVRRRSSISSTPATISNIGKFHSVPDGSPTSISLRSPPASQTPVPPGSQGEREQSQSVAERIANPSGGVHTIPMFQVPEKPVNDCEGFGSLGGGG